MLGVRLASSTWALTGPFADTSNGASCPTSPTSTTFRQPRVGIDGSGTPVGVIVRAENSTLCQGPTPVYTQIQTELLLLKRVSGMGNALQVQPDPVAAGQHISGAGPMPLNEPDIGVNGSSIVVSWTGANSDGHRVIRARPYQGDTAGATQDVDTSPSTTEVSPRVAVASGGAALLAWPSRGSGGLVEEIKAASRPAGGAFGAPVSVSGAGGTADGVGVHMRAAGDGLVTYGRGSAASRDGHARGFDATPPVITQSSFPPSATAGGPAVGFSASAIDFWGPLTFDWGFGDGTGATGAAVTHAFSSGGAFGSTLTVRDAVGNTADAAGTVQVSPPPPPPPPPPPGPPVPPVATPELSKVSVTNSRFRVGPSATALNASTRRRAPIGTRFRFTLNRAARTFIKLARNASGRQVGRRCLAPTRARVRAKRKKCTRSIAAGTLTRSAKRGANSVAFSGRVGRTKLPAGTYAATLSAQADGRTSGRRTLGIRIVK